MSDMLRPDSRSKRVGDVAGETGRARSFVLAEALDWPYHSDGRDELLRDIMNDVAGDDGGPRGSDNERGPARSRWGRIRALCPHPQRGVELKRRGENPMSERP